MAAGKISALKSLLIIGSALLFFLILISISNGNCHDNTTDDYKLRKAKEDEKQNVIELAKGNITQYLMDNLHDNLSYQPVEWGGLVPAKLKGYSYGMIHTYRAKNAFGALRLQEDLFLMDNDYKVIRVHKVR